ncbi:MAG: hypothetical protein M1812_006338 [Candelaria pacifica]|nr:MAG: hypothetical protein M1812_006338 [Candelaria pacifica]
MTVFSNFLSKTEPSPRTGRSSCPSSTQGREGLSTRTLSETGTAEDDFPTTESEHPDLRLLNNSLLALAAIFPDIQAEVLREMLGSFNAESRLEVATEALLKNKAKWVSGRWRVPGNGEDGNRQIGGIPSSEMFRTEGYKKAVRAALYHEFKGLSRSSINAVLAEHNHSYTLARPTLLVLSSKSWRFSLSSFFLRRKSSGLGETRHPLLVWQASETQGEILIPTLRDTGNQELDKELLDTIVAPLLRKGREQQVAEDRDLAVQANEAEAEKYNALHDCECCFTATSFEQLSACDDGGHLICFRCLRHAVNECLFGQGWASNVQHARGTLRCIAPMLNEECGGCIPHDLLKRALFEEKGGEDVWRKLEDRMVSENISKSNAPLIRCPFCAYAEIDDIYVPVVERSWRFNRTAFVSFPSLTILVLGTGMIPFLLPFIIISTLLFLTISSSLSLYKQIRTQLTNAHIRILRKRLGLKFICRNPTCARASCRNCSKEWRDIHVCFESERLALRAAVERAMAEAVKRTCPRCNLSFVKASGCNKLTCVCGYQMCYVCRKEVGEESYRHFCEHFRPDPGTACTVCDKCDLYKVENEEVAIKRAGLDAEREWRAREGIGIFGNDLISTGKRGFSSHDSTKMPRSWEILDWIVEQIIE